VAEHYPQVDVLNGDGNLWWSGAVNRGAKYALDVLGCEYILLWNNDIKPDIDYFSNLQNIVNKNADKNIIIGSKVYFGDRPNVIYSMGCIFDPRTGIKKLNGFNQADGDKYEEKIGADWCGGMGTLIHKSVFEKTGFWDEKAFPQYHSDCDFTLRAKKCGMRLFIYPDLRIYNNTDNSATLHSNSFWLLVKSFFSLKSHYNIAKNILFYRRHGESLLAYIGLARLYIGYIGGFFKWKILRLRGIKKST
jgi:GT2 family glycosyltransferase